MLLELAGLGVTLVSATENVNADTAEGELLQGIYAVINGFRSRQDGEDIQRKMTYKASKGGTVHRAPLGYLNVKKRIDGRLVSSVIIDDAGHHSSAWPLSCMPPAATATRRCKKN